MTADCINCVVKWCTKSGKYEFGDTCEDFVPITTNADKIRAMDDEDLAHFLWMRQFDDSMFPMRNTEMNSVTAWLGWLRSEAEPQDNCAAQQGAC